MEFEVKGHFTWKMYGIFSKYTHASQIIPTIGHRQWANIRPAPYREHMLKQDPHQ